MKIWGFAIPGLAMNASELPDIPGLVRLQSPGFNESSDLESSYSIEDLAHYHLDLIRSHVSADDEILIIGMSMGGMIASVLGSQLRNLLPKKTRFRFLVTSSNDPQLPCITKVMLAKWYQARPGDVESFAKILTPFVGRRFRETQPVFTQRYFQYRATGKNSQSAKAFLKQLDAVVRFNGSDYFAKLQPAEVEFIHGGSDEIMFKAHQDLLKSIQPQATHVVVAELGHMVNFEAPHLFQRERLSHA